MMSVDIWQRQLEQIENKLSLSLLVAHIPEISNNEMSAPPKTKRNKQQNTIGLC
jgi:hypothetical protein